MFSGYSYLIKQGNTQHMELTLELVITYVGKNVRSLLVAVIVYTVVPEAEV